MADRVPAGRDDVEGREAFDYGVFLSFASADQVAAQRIQETLERGGLRVFWAPEALRAALGQSFFATIQKSLVESRHFVLYWTAHAKASGWVAAEYETFFNRCSVNSKGARRLIILPDGREPISSLPSLLQSLQVAHSAADVVTWLAPRVEVPRKVEAPPVRPAAERAVRPAVSVSERKGKGVRVGGQKAGWAAVAVLVAVGALIGYLVYRPVEPSVKMPEIIPPQADPTAPKAGDAIAGPLGMRMRFVPSGTYTIGSPKGEAGRDTDETLHQVILTRGFWLAESELTQAQWGLLVRKQPSHFTACGENCPVENVSWYEAVEFANRLSDHEGLARCYELVNSRGSLGSGESGGFTCDAVTFKGFDCSGYRLPSETEWEVAVRAGGDPSRDTPFDPSAVAWFGDNAYSTTHSIGKKNPNRWGFFDLLGNVSEWTWDWYGDYPVGRAVNPLSITEGSNRVTRGGSWDSGARFVRAAFRNHFGPSRCWFDLGIRLARSQRLRPSAGKVTP